MNAIAFDFSISKPTCVVFFNNEYKFFMWPKNITLKHKELYQKYDISVIERQTIEYTDITKYDIVNANNLADLIIDFLMPYLNNETLIAFEGSSFASRGNVTLSLTAWRYFLIYRLMRIIPLDNIYTYAPITIKSIAGCAKKGMGKHDMITAFIQNGPECKIREALKETPELFQKKGGKNWIDNIDDIADSYWTLETLRKKMNRI
jgi:hypothetical protein